MKNKIFTGMSKIALITALATAVAATPVLASTGDLWNGSVNQGSVPSVVLNHPAVFLDMLAHLSNYSYEVNGKGYDIAQANAVFAANPTATAAAVQAIITSTLTGTTLSQTLAVSSVSAINAKQIDVTFNQALDATSAVDSSNYTVSGSMVVGTPVLSADAKTVSLPVDNAGDGLANDTAYTVTVLKGLKNAAGTALSATTDYTTGIFFSDHAKPTVTAVAAQPNGDVKITFSENLFTTVPTVVINGVSVTANTPVKNTVTVPKANLTAAAPVVGQSYPIVISGAADLVTSPNVMDLYTGTFAYNVVADVTAPVVSSIVAKDEKTLTLTFSEVINGAVVDGSTDNATALGLVVKKGTTTLTLAGNVTTTDGKVFTVLLPTSADTVYDSTKSETSATIEVTVAGFKDAALNLGTKTVTNVTVNKDTTAPTFAKVNYNYDASTPTIDFTFSKNLTTGAGALTAAEGGLTIVNATTGIATAVVSGSCATITGKTVTFDNSVATGLNLAAGNYTFSFAKGAIKDATLNGGNSIVAFSTPVVVTSAAPDTTKPTVVAVTPTTVGTKDTITVQFSEAVKGGSVVGSATDITNYKLNGAALPTGTVATLAAVSGGLQTVTIKLPAGSTASTSTMVLAIANVQDLAGNVLDAVNNTVTLTDSVKPELLSASVNATGQLVLNFSEEVATTTSGSIVAISASDFVVKVNGNDVTEVLVTPISTDDKKQVKLTASDASFATGIITVQTASGAAGTDKAANVVKASTVLTATR